MFNLIYLTPIWGSYILVGSNLEKYGISSFSGRLRPDCGNTTWVDMARFGSVGLDIKLELLCPLFMKKCL